MTTSRVRLVFLCAAVAALSGPSLAAQTTQTNKPVPTPPRLEQRFERPAQEQGIRVGDLVAMREQDYFYRRFRPIVRVGQDYALKVGETVHAVRSALADVRIDGRVERDVVVVLGNVTLSSTAVIDGSLVVIGGSATVQAGAIVDDDFVVIGGTATTPADFFPRGEHVVVGTPMLGDALRAVSPWLTRGLLMGRLIVPNLGWVWAIVGISFLIGLVLNHVFARQVAACADTLGRRPLSAFFMGLLVLLLAGPLLAIVAASIIGLAVVPFAIAALIVAGIIGKIGVTRSIGRSVVGETDADSRFESSRSYVLGFGAITLAYMVPVLGILTWAMVGVFGLGAATMTFAATLRRERPAPIPRAPVEPPPVMPPPAPPESAYPSPPEPVYRQATSAFVAAAPSTPTEQASESMVNEGAPPPRVDPPRSPRAPGAIGDLLWYPRASFLDRLAAFALDVVLIAISAAFLRSAFWFRRGGDDGEFMVFVLIYIIAFTAWKGTTLGGIICSLRVVRTNGADLRFIDALVRGLSSIFSIAALGIGCLWMLNDAERQMWHDKIAGTVVLKVPREVVLA